MFEKLGYFQASGLFSTEHTVSVLICFALVIIATYLTFETSESKQKLIFNIIKYVLTVTIIAELVVDIVIKNHNAESLIPLNFTLLFVVALWFINLKNKSISNIAKVLVAYLGLGFGGLTLIFTVPSFTNYPVFHIKCMFAVVNYSAMLYCGLALISNNKVKINIKSFKIALFMVADFVVDCLILNAIFGTNFLALFSPNGLNIEWLNSLWLSAGGVYSLVMVAMLFACVVLAYVVGKLIVYLIKKYNQQ